MGPEWRQGFQSGVYITHPYSGEMPGLVELQGEVEKSVNHSARFYL